MIKGILFDWNGVMVKDKAVDDVHQSELYKKAVSNTASQEEIKLLVQSFEKYEPLWDLLPHLVKHFKLCVVNNGPKATLDYWDEYFGYSKYMQFVNSEQVGISKPNKEIYVLACNLIGVEPSEVIYMDDNCGFPKETEDLKMEFIHWDTFDSGFEKFKRYLVDNLELII